MKILHTADWHLGKRLDFYSRLAEQKEVLEEIVVLADLQQVDAVIVAGDLFDAFNPAVEATELLYSTLKRLTNNGTRPVIAIAGNHDSPDRVDSVDPLAKACGIIFVGYPNATITPFKSETGFEIVQSAPGFLELRLAHLPYPLRVLTTAYANEIRLKQYLGTDDKAEQLNDVLHRNWQALANKYCDHTGVNILTAHLYMLKRGGEILEEPEGEKPINIGNADIIYTDGIPKQIQYTALGHLHRYQHIGGHHAPVVYSSSPLAYSFSESGQEKKVVIIDIEPDKPVHISAIPLRKGKVLSRKRFADIDLAVSWLLDNPDTLVELTIVSESFISSSELKRLHESHDGIIHIIPIVKQQEPLENEKPSINLDQNMEDLFIDFFKSKHVQAPNEDIMNLFKEVLVQTKDIEE